MMSRKLNQRQESFCINYFQTSNGTQSAITAGYSAKTAYVIASENLRKPKIKARLAELRGKVDSSAIMEAQEAQERLTEIARAKLTDFMELGQDGSWVNLGPETPKSAAIAEIHSRTEYDDNGAKPTIYTSVKLHDPLKAIDLLSKLRGYYAPEKSEIVLHDVNKGLLLEKLIRYFDSRRAEIPINGQATELNKPVESEGSKVVTGGVIQLEPVGKAEPISSAG